MKSLTAFMAENALNQGIVKFAVSPRFVDPDTKEPMEWELKPITSGEDEELKKSCMHNVQIIGRKNQYERQLNMNKYLAALAVKCTVFPDLHNAELQDSYKVKGAEALLQTMLLAGEYADLLVKIQEICGFTETFEELVDEAKN